MKKIIISILVLLITMVTYSQEITGQWEGKLSIQGTSLRLVFNIDKSETGFSATMDSPDQGAKGLKMSHASFENNVLTLELRIAGIKYTGTLDKNNITGTFSQAGQTMPLNLVKNENITNIETKPSFEKNDIFAEEGITLQTSKGKLYGTVTVPKKWDKGSLAIIIAGSGPTDRNCNNPSMTCDAYKKLAHELAANNIATLRYDKRGIAESVAAVENESDLIFDDYVNDVRDWVKLMKQDKRFNKIILIGHSEGSQIGIIASDNVDKVISIAGPGRSADALLKEQLTAQPKEFQDLAFPIIDKLVKGEKVDNVNPMVSSIFRQSVQPYLISWFKYDPQKEIKKLKIPVLIIQGSNDIQVTVKDAELLSASKPDSKLVIIDKMNHVLRSVDGDRQANLATYNNASLPLADGLVKNIADFINKK